MRWALRDALAGAAAVEFARDFERVTLAGLAQSHWGDCKEYFKEQRCAPKAVFAFLSIVAVGVEMVGVLRWYCCVGTASCFPFCHSLPVLLCWWLECCPPARSTRASSPCAL